MWCSTNIVRCQTFGLFGNYFQILYSKLNLYLNVVINKCLNVQEIIKTGVFSLIHKELVWVQAFIPIRQLNLISPA